MTAEQTCMRPLPHAREDAEPTDEQQHQESGQGMQLHREAAGRFGVHLHDPGQWGTFPAFVTAVADPPLPLPKKGGWGGFQVV